MTDKVYTNEHPKHNKDKKYSKDKDKKDGINFKSKSEGGDTYGWKPHDTFYDKFGKYLTPYWYLDKVLDKKKKTKD